jgi:hypothetical protein
MVVPGHRPVNRAAFVIHAQVHAARPDVVAAGELDPLIHGNILAMHQPILGDPVPELCSRHA